MPGIIVLSVNDVLTLHENTIQVEGGSPGVRDFGLLESAVMMPQQQWGGAYLHEGLAAMAAAYQFHISANHPFIDGNKRAAVAAALVFLRANAVPRLFDPIELERVTMQVAASQMSKDDLITWWQKQLAETPSP